MQGVAQSLGTYVYISHAPIMYSYHDVCECTCVMCSLSWHPLIGQNCSLVLFLRQQYEHNHCRKKKSASTEKYKEENYPITKRNIDVLYLVLGSFHMANCELFVLFFKIEILPIYWFVCVNDVLLSCVKDEL